MGDIADDDKNKTHLFSSSSGSSEFVRSNTIKRKIDVRSNNNCLDLIKASDSKSFDIRCSSSLGSLSQDSLFGSYDESDAKNTINDVNDCQLRI